MTPEQAFGVLSAEFAETVVENRIMRVKIVELEAKVKELTPPPEGEKASLEVVK